MVRVTAITKQHPAQSAPMDDSVKPIQRIIEQLREASADASNIVEAANEPENDESPALSAEADAESDSKGFQQVRATLNHIFMALVLCVAGLALVWTANKRFAPLLFDDAAVERVADAFSEGRNYAVFDLNIDIRDLRNAHIAKLSKAPEVAILGASHWQEAHAYLLPSHDMYNSHVHRDYYEDMLAVTEMYIRHGKLPGKMIITIRDNLFTPVSERTDFLWLPGIKYYRVMALRLGLQPHSKWLTLPVENWKEQLSFNFLRENLARELAAPAMPHATRDQDFRTLDTLLPDGSIRWSGEHLDSFTRERSRKEALAFADMRRNDPPRVDPEGVKAIDALLGFLKGRGVEVYLAHPPFNPLFHEAVAGSPYERGLAEIIRTTKSLAEKYRIPVIGSFDANEVGCSAAMYIDAEHAGPECLAKILNEFARLDQANEQASQTKRGQ